MALELKLSEFHPVAVSFNYEELKKEIADRTLPYKGLIVTEEAIPTAKADLAKLRKLEKAIDDRRKDVKKEYNAPYMEFEKKIKDILSDIQEAEQNIDSQVKGFEKQAEDEKLAQIQKFFRLSFGDDLAEYVNFGKLYNPKWLNKGYKMPEIEEEIAAAANKLHADIDVVKGLKSSHEVALMKTLFNSLDLGEVLVEHNTLVEFEERKKAEELAKQDAVEPEPNPVVETPVAEDEQEIAVDTPEPLQQIDFRVWVNEDQKAAIKHFLVSNGIRYGSIK
jgi:hypothetical protein